MPAPVIESSNSSGYIANGSDMVITKPSGTVSGDLLICIQLSASGGSRWYNVGSTGFTHDKTHTLSANGTTYTRVFYKVAGGSEPSTYTFTKSDNFVEGRGYMFRISGAEDPATTALVHSGSSSGSGGNATFPDISPTDNDSLVLRSIGLRRNGASASPPTGHNEEFDENTTNMSLATYSKTEASGSTGTYAVSYLPTWHGVHACTCVAIAPAAAGGVASDWYQRLQERLCA